LPVQIAFIAPGLALLVLGATWLVDGAVVMIAVALALACLPTFASGHRIARREGALFPGYYAVHASCLTLATTQHTALPANSATMAGFVLPLTVVTLAVLLARHRTLPTTALP